MATTRNNEKNEGCEGKCERNAQKNREITIAIMLFYPIRCFSYIICYSDKIKYYVK